MLFFSCLGSTFALPLPMPSSSSSASLTSSSATLTHPSASCWPLDGPSFDNNVNEPCCGMWPRYQAKMGMQSNDLFFWRQSVCSYWTGTNIPKSRGRTPWGGDWWLLVLWVSKTSRGPHPITADMTVAVGRDSTDSFTSIHKYLCLL